MKCRQQKRRFHMPMLMLFGEPQVQFEAIMLRSSRVELRCAAFGEDVIEIVYFLARGHQLGQH